MLFAERMEAMAKELGWSIEYDNRDNSISIRTPEKSMAVSQEDSAEETIFQFLDFLVELKNQRKAEGMSDRLDGLEKQVKSVKEQIERMKSLFREPEDAIPDEVPDDLLGGVSRQADHTQFPASAE